MASFTDIIPQFNPYIQQLPIEAMVQVGMEKQAQYDAGVQKIQAQIDNVAGLDLAKDVDKQYLQSKLNQLGNDLKIVAGGDFSNFQLVNSVGGMAKQIGKDEAIQNAVSSTAWYRKQNALMEEAIKSGKSSQSNIYDFNEKTANWLNSDKIGEVFRDRYTQFKDTKKVALEAIKALHPKLQQYDIPFEVKDGKINTAIIADAMQRYKIEGIDESQIQQAISAAFTPDDWNQLRIDARYQFRGVTPDQLEKRAELLYVGKKARYESELDATRQKRTIATDPTLIADLDKRIQFYEDQLGKDGKSGILDNELRTNVDLARTNPDDVKYSIYRDGYVSEFANAFSWKNQEMQYVDSPLKKQQNWRSEMALKWATENRQRYEFAENLKRKDIELDLEAEKNALKKIELGLVPTDTRVPVGNPTDITNNADGIVLGFTNEVSEKINGGKAELKQRGLTDGQINSILDDYRKNGAKAKSAPAWAIKTVQEILRQENVLASVQEMETNAKASAQAATLNDPAIKGQIAERTADLTAINNGKSITFTQYAGRDPNTGQGKYVKFSRTGQQLIEDIKAGRASLRVDKAPLGNIQVTFNNVPEAGGKSVSIQMKKNSFGTDVVGGGEMRNALKEVSAYYDKHGNFENNYQSIYNRNYKNILAPVANELVPTIIAVRTGNKSEVPPRVINNLSAFISANDAKSIQADDNFSTSTASDFLSEKKNKDTRVFIQQDGDKFEVLIKNEQDPTNIQRLKMSGSDVARYIGADYIDNLTQDSKVIRLSGGSGTNITKNPNRAVMQQTFGDFPGIRKLQVKGDLIQEAGSSGFFYPTFYVKRKDGGWQPFEISGQDQLQRVGYEQGKKQMNSLTDAIFLSLLKESYPSFDFSTLDY
jgi:hypothetical protein